MLSSQILRSVAALQGVAATSASKAGSRVMFKAPSSRARQWAVIEAKRIVPTVAMWATSMTIMLGWPFGVRAIVH